MGTTARFGRLVLWLVAGKSLRGRRKLGALRGKIRVGDDFDAPIPPEVLDLFEGRSP